jgi:hypothetical protein
MKLFALACLFAINWFVLFVALCVAIILFVSVPIPGGIWTVGAFSGLLACIQGLASHVD